MPSIAHRSLVRAACIAALALLVLPAAVANADDPAPPQLSLQPGTLDFGLVEVDRGGQSSSVNVQNAGPDSAIVDSSWIDGPDTNAFWIEGSNCPGQSLPQGGNCQVYVRFGPSQGRAYDATLHVSTGGAEFTAALKGVGGMRQITPTPSPLDFGPVDVGESATRSLTMSNTGNIPFQSIVAIPTGGDVGAFRVMEDGCSLRLLMPGIGCKLEIRFTPFEADNAEATFAFLGEGNPTIVTLRGIGREPAVAPASGKDRARKARAARVAFDWRRGQPAPYRRGKVDLGVARCKGAASCRVTVRARFISRRTWVAAAGDRITGTRTSHVCTSTWRVGHGTHVSLRLPPGLAGTPIRLIADLRVTAAGHPAGAQRLRPRLVPGRRFGTAIIAAPRAPGAPRPSGPAV